MQTDLRSVITAVEVRHEDWPEYIACVDRIRALVLKDIDPVWKVLHGPVSLTFNGCEIIKRLE